MISHPEIDLSVKRLHGELIAAGVRFNGVAADGTILGLNPEDITLANLILAARDKIIASTECQAVKTVLGSSSSQWTAYQAIRNTDIEQKRTEKLLVEIVTMIVELFYTATPRVVTEGIFLGFDQTRLVEAKQRINEIKAELPYLL